MKKILILMTMLLPLGFASCDDDDDDNKKYCYLEREVETISGGYTTYRYYCRNCGTETYVKAKQCYHCGYWFLYDKMY